MTWTVADVVARLPDRAGEFPELPAPPYSGMTGERRTAMMVESMRRHTTDEGWQLGLALAAGGYGVTGHNIGVSQFTDAGKVLEFFKPDVLFLQDKREWSGKTAGPGFDERERFTNVGALRGRADVFKGTVLKDAQHDPGFHREAADEMGAHFWVTYYHPAVVKRLAPYVRERHLVRTYHTVDKGVVPVYTPGGRTDRGLVSGALSGAYPLRLRCARMGAPNFDVLQHPGYGRAGCHTPGYLLTLTRYKVAVCTASRFGYLLRKIVEATAAGCVVVTDLPADEAVPGIDGNLVRVHHDASGPDVAKAVRAAVAAYSPELQAHYAAEAVRLYDYRAEGKRLADAVETLRREYRG